jgi:hypothetical protein
MQFELISCLLLFKRYVALQLFTPPTTSHHSYLQQKRCLREKMSHRSYLPRWFRAICPDIFSASYFVPELLDETKGRPISLLEFFLPCLDSLVRPLDLLGDLFWRDVLGHGLNQ